MPVTTLDPRDKGVIKCRECGREFPPFRRSANGHGRSGWSLLREHFMRRHPLLKTALERGISDWSYQNQVILADSHRTGMDSKVGSGRDD